MFVGICRITFNLPDNNSLKGKRQIVRKLVERTRAKFNASVAEVAANDAHRTTVIGACVVGNDAAHVDAMLAKIASFLETMGIAEPTRRETEQVNMHGEFGCTDINPLQCPAMYDFDFESE